MINKIDTDVLYNSITDNTISGNIATIKVQINYLREIFDRNPIMYTQCQLLLEKGIDALSDDEYWLELEIVSQTMDHNDDFRFRSALHYLKRLKYPESKRPSVLYLYQPGIDLIYWYRMDPGLGKSIALALTSLKEKSYFAESTNQAYGRLSVQCLKLLCEQSNDIKQGLIEEGLDWFKGVQREEIVLRKHGLKNEKKILLREQLIRMVHEHNPEIFLVFTVQINGSVVDVTDLVNASPCMHSELKSIAASDKFVGNENHDVLSLRRRFIANIKTLRSINEAYPTLMNVGLESFKTHEYSLLSKSQSILRKDQFSELVNFLEQHFKHEIHRHFYTKKLLTFFFPDQNKYRNIDYSRIEEKAPNTFQEVLSIYHSEVSLSAHKNYDLEALHTRFSKLQRILLNYAFPKYLKNFEEYGVVCLSRDNNRIQKSLFQQLQSQVKNNLISTKTGSARCGVIRWLMEITGQNVVDAFTISFKKHQIHSRKLRMEDLYTNDELRELVFYIEKGISLAKSEQQVIALYFARIQLKTCWNTSAMADIELTDIASVNLPTSKKSITVLIQKPRKGYVTDIYTLDGKTTISVMRDILYLKDNLTARYRYKSKSTTVKKYLFIFEEKTKIYRLDHRNIVSYIKELLCKLGSSVIYNSMRIRKSGVNHLYREVSKQVQAYEQIKLHSFDTFIKHYQRISESETQQNLQKATHVMQRYFTGREIEPRIEILMEDDLKNQKTPTGLCASKGADIEAKQYMIEHKNSDVNKDDKWCSDFLACVWCKHFRTVADAEHVWQLLSYRDFVLADMRASIINIDNNGTQKEAIDALENRVSSILENVRQMNRYAVNKGEALLKENGMHPFWGFAISSAEVSSEGAV